MGLQGSRNADFSQLQLCVPIFGSDKVVLACRLMGLNMRSHVGGPSGWFQPIWVHYGHPGVKKWWFWPVCPIPVLWIHFLAQKSQNHHCALNIVSPSSQYARTTLTEPKNWPAKLESGKMAKIIISGPLEAHRALILVGITLIDPQHDSTMSHNVGYT